MVTLPGGGLARDKRFEWAALATVTLLALVLRVYRLTDWSLSDDEYLTWKDSLDFSWSNPRPLLYALDHFLVGPIFGLREFGLRIVPAAVGIATVLVVYAMLRRLGLRMPGLAMAALVALSPWHVYWSQFARYYTMVFLFSAACGLALLGWVRFRRAGWLSLAGAAGVLAVLAHPSALPVVGSGFLIVAFHEWRSGRRAFLWPWTLTLAGAFTVAVARYGPILARWTTQRESACCHTSVGLALSFLDWMTAPILVCAFAGMAIWWWTERAPVPQIVVATAIIPTALFIGLSSVMSISLSYLFAAAPFYFLAAGWFLARIATSATAPGRPALVACALAVTIVASANLVGLASHFRDGGRLPYRDVATALTSLTGAQDTILAEGTGHLHFYDPKLSVEQLPLDSLSLSNMVHRGGVRWVLAPRVDRAGFGYYELEFAQVNAWLDGHCALVKDFSTPRLDFRRNALELFRCVPDIHGTALSGGPIAAEPLATGWSK